MSKCPVCGNINEYGRFWGLAFLWFVLNADTIRWYGIGYVWRCAEGEESEAVIKVKHEHQQQNQQNPRSGGSVRFQRGGSEQRSRDRPQQKRSGLCECNRGGSGTKICGCEKPVRRARSQCDQFRNHIIQMKTEIEIWNGGGWNNYAALRTLKSLKKNCNYETQPRPNHRTDEPAYFARAAGVFSPCPARSTWAAGRAA